MSADGSTFLFDTAANNFYQPGPTIQLFAYADGSGNPWTLRSTLVNGQIRGFTSGNKRGVFVG